jgi:hypothetical protein
MEDAGGILQRDALIALDSYWRVRNFDYAGGANVIYQGAHAQHNADEGDVIWAVWKYTYDASSNITKIEGPLTGSWTGRAALSWL